MACWHLGAGRTLLTQHILLDLAFDGDTLPSRNEMQGSHRALKPPWCGPGSSIPEIDLSRGCDWHVFDNLPGTGMSLACLQ